jgi:hypothetical protein
MASFPFEQTTLVAGTELMRALVGVGSLEELARGVDALPEKRDARRTLLATLIALRFQRGNRAL